MLDAAALLTHARDGALLLAPNLRSARQLRTRMTSEQSGSGFADLVLHWRGWTARLWQQALLSGVEDRALLQPMQEKLLWEFLLDDDPAVERTDALVDLCVSAASLVYRHGARESLLRSQPATGDPARFAHWFRSFDQHCQEQRLLPGAALEGALAAHIAARNLPKYQPLVLCGLADPSPAQQHLLEVIRNAGTPVTVGPALQGFTLVPPVLMRCADDRAEQEALLARLDEALRAATRTTIAIVVPDLSISRDRIERSLREHFAPASKESFREERQPLWEFSTGRPLAAYGIVADALRLLAWTTRDLSAIEVSALLQSPYLDWPVDAESAATLDAGLLRRNSHLHATWSPAQTAQALASRSPALADALRQHTRTWPSLRGANASHSSLVAHTRRLLHDFGWPGPRTRTSEEFQAVQRWDGLLDSLIALDLISSQTTWGEFQHRLMMATREISFARENTGAPIQFLTLEESTGTEADHLWLMHADEGTWNSRETAHPLLPWRLQQQHGMPGVDPARDHTRFHEGVNRLLALAPHVTFTYSSAGESGEQRPSPLLIDLPGIAHCDAPQSNVIDQIQAAAHLQTFMDDAVVPLALTAEPVRGGTRILQNQAACAFRAFAELRLGAAALETTDLGMDARERGSLLHRALHLFWAETKNQKSLLQLINEQRLPQAIDHAIMHALAKEERAIDAWSRAYLQIQRDRLAWLLEHWLRKEAERPDFEVVALEQEMDVAVGPLTLKVKVDRIDAVTVDGVTSRVILDYKTGDMKAKKWEGDRPEEPQLPLYATALPIAAETGPEQPVGAIAFGVVRPGSGMAFRSMPNKSALLSTDPKANHAALGVELEMWRNTLQTLAEDYAAGIASVGPRDYPATCRFCEQRLFCRLNPELLEETHEDAEADA